MQTRTRTPGDKNVAPLTILVIPRGQGKSITHLWREIVPDPGGRLYQAGIGTIRRDLDTQTNTCPLMMMPLFLPPVSYQVLLFNHHLLMMSFLADRFIVGVCEDSSDKEVFPG